VVLLRGSWRFARCALGQTASDKRVQALEGQEASVINAISMATAGDAGVRLTVVYVPSKVGSFRSDVSSQRASADAPTRQQLSA
jgi:hypothetical protein